MYSYEPQKLNIRLILRLCGRADGGNIASGEFWCGACGFVVSLEDVGLPVAVAVAEKSCTVMRSWASLWQPRENGSPFRFTRIGAGCSRFQRQ